MPSNTTHSEGPAAAEGRRASDDYPDAQIRRLPEQPTSPDTSSDVHGDPERPVEQPPSASWR